MCPRHPRTRRRCRLPDLYRDGWAPAVSRPRYRPGDALIRNRWTDFLPVVLPTEERVARMLKGTRQPPRQNRRPDASDRVSRVQRREGRGQCRHGRGAVPEPQPGKADRTDRRVALNAAALQTGPSAGVHQGSRRRPHPMGLCDANRPWLRIRAKHCIFCPLRRTMTKAWIGSCESEIGVANHGPCSKATSLRDADFRFLATGAEC